MNSLCDLLFTYQATPPFNFFKCLSMCSIYYFKLSSSLRLFVVSCMYYLCQHSVIKENIALCGNIMQAVSSLSVLSRLCVCVCVRLCLCLRVCVWWEAAMLHWMLISSGVWWCHTFWCHVRVGWTKRRGREDGQTKELLTFTADVTKISLMTWTSTSFKNAKIFFKNLSDHSPLLTSTAISGCYGNSHTPNQSLHLPYIAITKLKRNPKMELNIS